MTAPADVVGQEPQPRRTPRLLLPVLLAVAALLLLLDGVQGRREVDALVARAAAGEQAADYADRRVAGTVQYAGSQLTTGPAAVRADLQRLVAREAQGQRAVVRT
ncbi:MAG: hypothetical protein JWO60_1984, partial [Frankiales bacterium]|nr:hypothetical protein [Frankiales bacterium]